MGVLQLYMTDFCPFAQRTWLALLEKEDDPHNPKRFNWIEVNYFNPSLPRTQEFLKIHNTVPCGVIDGEILRESMPMAYWADEQRPDFHPLQPSSDEAKATMKSLISKFTSGEFDVVATFYNALFAQPDEEADKLAALTSKLLAAYRELARELAARGGPYLMGDQFTLADIALIPFVDRATLLLGHYKKFVVPESDEYAAFHAWRRAYRARPSHQISDADRLPRSIEVQPFGATKRDEYVIEMYTGYAYNVREQIRRQLRVAPPGQATQDVARAIAEKKAEQAAVAAKQKQHKVLAIAAAVGVGAIIAAKIAQIVRKNNKAK